MIEPQVAALGSYLSEQHDDPSPGAVEFVGFYRDIQGRYFRAHLDESGVLERWRRRQGGRGDAFHLLVDTFRDRPAEPGCGGGRSRGATRCGFTPRQRWILNMTSYAEEIAEILEWDSQTRVGEAE